MSIECLYGQQETKMLSQKIMIVKMTFYEANSRPEPDNPAKLPDDNPIPARTEGPVGQRRVSVLKNRQWRVEWRFASPKPEQLEPTGATKKSGQILQKQARSGEISTKSREISTKSDYI